MIAQAHPPFSTTIKNCKQLIAVNDFLQLWHAVFKQQRCSDQALAHAIDRCVYAWSDSQKAQERVLANWAAAHGALREEKKRKALRYAKRCVHLCRTHNLSSCLWELSNEVMWHVCQKHDMRAASDYWQAQFIKCKQDQ